MIFSYLLNMQSHPSWVCGLKLQSSSRTQSRKLSHPSWVCGLKLLLSSILLIRYSVTPFVGVWIETKSIIDIRVPSRSHPSWVCGLKLQVYIKANAHYQSHPSWVCGLKHNQTILIYLE